MKPIQLSECTISVDAEYEEARIEGNALASDNDAENREAEQTIKNALAAGNRWAWCCAAVTVRYGELSETEFLGCCSYDSEDDFRNDGDFEQMCDEALERLNSRIEKLQR